MKRKITKARKRAAIKRKPFCGMCGAAVTTITGIAKPVIPKKFTGEPPKRVFKVYCRTCAG